MQASDATASDRVAACLCRELLEAPVGEDHGTDSAVLVVSLKGKLVTWMDELASAAERVMSGADTEAVHDLRVATRRIRSLLRALRAVFGKFHVDRIRAQLKTIGDVTSVLRDLEVLDLTLADLALSQQHREALTPWRQHLIVAQQTARERVAAYLATAQWKRPLLQLRALVLLPVKPSRQRRALAYARRTLRRFHKQVQRQLPVNVDDAQALHALRIRYKRVRYCAEALVPWLRPRMQGWEQRAKNYQDVLGRIHDIDVARQAVLDADRLMPQFMPDSLDDALLQALAVKRQELIGVYLQMQDSVDSPADASTECAQTSAVDAHDGDSV